MKKAAATPMRALTSSSVERDPSRTTRGAAPAAVGGLLLLASPTGLAAQEHAIFSVDIGLVIWTWVFFLLTLGLLAWKVFPYIAGSLEDRQKRIQDSIDEAHRARAEAEGYRDEQRRELEAARREAQAFIERGRETAENMKRQFLEEARKEQQELLERARREIARERQQLLVEVRREAVEVALAAAERLLEQRLDSPEHRRLVTEYVTRLR